jgi:hypothetical protein
MDLPNFQNAKRWWKAFKEWPLKYRILLVTIAAAVVGTSVFGPLIKNLLSRDRTKIPERPMFFVTNPNIRLGSKIIIVAENTSANLNSILKVEYDGIVFPNGGIPISDSNPQQWYFTLHDKELPGEMLKEGTHELRFSFFGGVFSDISKIIISKKAPTPLMEIPKLDLSKIGKEEKETMDISSARDFIRAIRPNREIRLSKGTYNLSMASQLDSEYVTWKKTYDGFEPLIHNVYNLRIVGEGNTCTKILIQPRYAWVLSFQNSKNISIENLRIAHALEGFCTGGVLSFVDVDGIELENLILYGCGSTGIQMDKVDSFTCQYTLINHCTYNLLSVYNSENIFFQNCAFANSGQFNLIEIGDLTYNTKFFKCMFLNNKTVFNMPYLLDMAENAHDVSIVDSVFLDNKIQKFARRDHKLVLKDNNFFYNAFQEREVVGLNKTLINKYPLGYRLLVLVDEKTFVTCSVRHPEELSYSRFDLLDWESAKIAVGEEEIEFKMPDFSTVGLWLDDRQVSIKRKVGSESSINCNPDREVVTELLYDKGKNLIVVIGFRYIAGKTHDSQSE